jgi:hypothetical protein
VFVEDEADNLRRFHDGLEGKIRYNPIALAPVNNQYEIEYEKDLSYAYLNFSEQIDFDQPSEKKGDNTAALEKFLVTTIDFRVLYGNEPTTKITVLEVNSLEGKVEILDEEGVVTISDLCEYETGGHRLLQAANANPQGTTVITASTNNIEMELNTVESVSHTLVIYNSNGQIIHTEVGFSTPGSYHLNITGLDLAPGSYYTNFTGHTHTVQDRFMIID